MKGLMVTVILIAGAMLAVGNVALADTYTFGSGNLTTTNQNSWGGYNSQSYGVGGYGFNVDAGPITVEYLGVSLYSINYTGDMGWPPDATDTGASVIVGLGNGVNIAQYSVKSNMSGNNVRPAGGTGKGSWNNQTTGYWNDDDYRSYLFQGQFTNNWTETVGNSQYNAEKHGGPTGLNPNCDTFDIKMVFEKVGDHAYKVTGWHRLWESSARNEACYWDWNPAGNAINPDKRGYRPAFEGSWTGTGLDLSNAMPFLAIQNWGTPQPALHTFDWDGVTATGTLTPEPATMALLAAGGIATLLRRRRSGKK
jgi:hypothetical protein